MANLNMGADMGSAGSGRAPWRQIKKRMRKLPKSHPFYEPFTRLLAGELVICDDVKPFVDALSMGRQSRNVTFLTAWALGLMTMNDDNKTLASAALVNLVNNELVFSSKPLRLRFITYFSCVLAAFTVYYSFVWPLRDPVMKSPPSGLSVPAMIRFADHQDALFTHTMLIHSFLLAVGPTIVQLVALPLALNISATGYCAQLEQMAQLSLHGLNQPESTAVRVKSTLRYRLKATKLKVNSWFFVDGIRKKKGDLITAMMDAISTQHRGQLGPQATELISKLLLELEYVQYDPSHTKVVISTLGALSRAGDSSAIPTVGRVLKRTRDCNVRVAAEQTLKALEQHRQESDSLLRAADNYCVDDLLRIGTTHPGEQEDLLKPIAAKMETEEPVNPIIAVKLDNDEEKSEIQIRPH